MTSPGGNRNPALNKMQYPKAKAIADKIVAKLEPHCEKIHIAGSVRRMKPDCGDIEIVCEPKRIKLHNLFGPNITHTSIKGDWSPLVNSLGSKIKGEPTGKYIQIKLPEGINLDLFMPETEDYYRMLAIRTGSADYSAKVLAAAWVRLGWCGSDAGLRRQSDCFKKELAGGKHSWHCVNLHGEVPPEWESELHFFEWLNINYLEPKFRNL